MLYHFLIHARAKLKKAENNLPKNRLSPLDSKGEHLIDAVDAGC